MFMGEKKRLLFELCKRMQQVTRLSFDLTQNEVFQLFVHVKVCYITKSNLYAISCCLPLNPESRRFIVPLCWQKKGKQEESAHLPSACGGM